MATFKRTAITEKGKELISRAMSNETKINFTKVETTAFIYSEAIDITKVLALDNPVQRVGISEITRKNEKVVLKIALTNENVANTYKINAIGVYAKDDSNNEILFALLIANDPDTIEKKKGQTATTITIDLIFALSDSMQINLNMDNSATVTARMFNDLKINIENSYIQKIDYATEQKNGIAKIYSEAEANTDIPKIENLVKTNANETAWDRLIEGLNHTKIVTIKNTAKLFRKVLKPATETDQGLITEKKVKDLASSVIPEASETMAGKVRLGTTANTALEGKRLAEIIGIEFGGNIQAPGTKTVGKFYYDTVTKFYYECIESNSLTYNDTAKFRAISNKPISDRLEDALKIKSYRFPFAMTQAAVVKQGKICTITVDSASAFIGKYPGEILLNIPEDFRPAYLVAVPAFPNGSIQIFPDGNIVNRFVERISGTVYFNAMYITE